MYHFQLCGFVETVKNLGPLRNVTMQTFSLILTLFAVGVWRWRHQESLSGNRLLVSSSKRSVDSPLVLKLEDGWMELTAGEVVSDEPVNLKLECLFFYLWMGHRRIIPFLAV